MSDALPYSWSALYSKITEGVPEVNFEKLAPMCPLIAAEIALSSLSLCIYLHTEDSNPVHKCVFFCFTPAPDGCCEIK